MSHRERMSSVDTTWLRMDRPTNLMMIVGVWMLEGPVDLERVEAQIVEGLLSYRRYRQLVERTPAAIYWRDDPNFDLSPSYQTYRACPGAAASTRSNVSPASSPPSRSIPTTRSGRFTSSTDTRAAPR